MDVINYSKIKKVEKEVEQVKTDILEHFESAMPHLIVDEDTGKTYRYGRRFKDGGMQTIWEEVV